MRRFDAIASTRVHRGFSSLPQCQSMISEIWLTKCTFSFFPHLRRHFCPFATIGLRQDDLLEPKRSAPALFLDAPTRRTRRAG